MCKIRKNIVTTWHWMWIHIGNKEIKFMLSKIIFYCLSIQGNTHGEVALH